MSIIDPTNPTSTPGVPATESLRELVPHLICANCQQLLERRDIHCGNCKTCGQDFDADDPATYRTRRVYQPWQFWLPGFLLAFVSGVSSYAICIQTGELGWALFVAVPLSFGAILGYSNRVGVLQKVLLSLVLISAVCMAIMALNVAGFFCGATLAVVFIGPTIVGLMIGSILRIILRETSWSQRHFLPLALFVLLPFGIQAIEANLPRRTEVAIVETDLHVFATPEEAWNAIMFYEEVEHSPPWLLRFALPKPIRSVGTKHQEGQLVKCFYDRGHLLKRISEVVPRRHLSFEVIEQKLHFERDVTLKSGSFSIDPVNLEDPSAGVRIRLRTDYERHLRPTAIWQPIETRVVRTLHQHVLEGMQRFIETRRDKASHRKYKSPNGSPLARQHRNIQIGS